MSLQQSLFSSLFRTIFKQPDVAAVGLILFHKLESALNLLAPIVGVVLVNSYAALTFEPGKFNNGAHIPTNTPDASQYLRIPFESFSFPPDGCIEFWFIPDFDWNGTQSSDTNNHHFIAYVNSEFNNATQDQIYLELSHNEGLIFDLYTQSGGANRLTDTSQITWNTSELHHIAFVWSNTLGFQKIFFDGVEKASATGLTLGLTSKKANVFVGLHAPEVFLNNGAGSIMDNLKWWNYAKVDFSDRNTENASSPI